MRIRCYKIIFLKDGSLEPHEVIIPSHNQESARRNIERHGLRIVSIKFLGWHSFDISIGSNGVYFHSTIQGEHIIIRNTHYGYTYLYNSLDSKQPHLHS